MKILITGGAGFIGSNFIRYYLAKYKKDRIVNLDKLTYAGNLDNLRDIEKNKNYKFIKGDIADIKDVEKAMLGVDVIINYAAETHVDRSISSPDAFIKTDVLGTFTLLEVAKKYHIKKFIQISTDEVFGEIEKGETDEESPFRPRSPYSASKAGADHLALAYFTTYNLPVIITHSCNVFGPYQYPEKLLPRFITNLIENKKVPIYGKGNQVREWIFTEDHCRAIDTIIHKGKIGEVYNIGTKYRKTNLEITNKIIKLMNKTDREIEYVKDRPGHDVRYALNADKLKKLGWKPEQQFNQALEITVEWYKNNIFWWKPLKKKSELIYKNWGK